MTAVAELLAQAEAGCHLVWAIEIDRETKSAKLIIDRAAVDAALCDEDRPASKSLHILQMTIAPDGASDNVTVVRG